MTDILGDLNDAQLAAVKATAGPVLMLAGAGSGKTKTLTHRIAYILSQKLAQPSQILAVTFTNKAAGEMRARVNALLGRNPQDRSALPYLGTFHSIAVRILRREAIHIEYPESFVIYDEADAQAVVKTIMRELSIDEKVFTPSSVRHYISSAKNELVGPSQYARMAVGKIQEAVAEIYPRYQRELKAAGAMDFDDLILKLVELFEQNPEVLAEYQDRFRYILVDEYQDTNAAQYRLVNLLAQQHKNICVVGDDWQSIYSWRGANYENILNFETDYPNAKVVKLEQNYRSTQHILDAAHAVITKNVARSDKKLWTHKDGGAKIVVQQVASEFEEGRFIIQTIDEQVRMQHLNLRDFAVLYRTNAQSRALEEAFIRYNIPYQIVGGLRFYARREIKDILSYLRFICNPNDWVSFGRIVNVPPRGVGEASLARFTAHAREAGGTILENLVQADKVPGLVNKAKTALRELGHTLQVTSTDCASLPINEAIELVINSTGYKIWLDDGTPTGADRMENVLEFIGVAKAHEGTSLDEFLAEIALITDLDEVEQKDAVTLMTLHSAKGLEFDTVFIAGMEEGILPHSRTMFEPSELEEERRLAYVGMTRARNRLYLLYSTSRLLYGSTQHNLPSRFISDIPSTLTTQVASAGVLGALNFMETTAPIEPEVVVDYEVGDNVRHPTFGEGVITHMSGAEVSVNFERIGTKLLSTQFAPLKKVE